MTNNEILQANLLDILFDGRNKDYGAYALRRGYNNRLLMSLGIGTSVILVFVLINVLHSDNVTPNVPEKKFHVISCPMIFDIETEIIHQPQPHHPQQAATIRYTTPVIVDNIPLTEMPDVADIGDNIISTETREGPATGVVTTDHPGNSNVGTTTAVTETIEPMGLTIAPEFPGGFEALKEYLSRNLYTPESLEVGEKKIVRARFIVDKDGSVSTIEIELSAGKVFDREVIRVCKKMPKWKPALQNGHPVTVTYTLPVTFVGVEQ